MQKPMTWFLYNITCKSLYEYGHDIVWYVEIEYQINIQLIWIDELVAHSRICTTFIQPLYVSVTKAELHQGQIEHNPWYSI